jgi:hypothetical protein
MLKLLWVGQMQKVEAWALKLNQGGIGRETQKKSSDMSEAKT